ncbi:MAG TPA: BamA/TamA family outer membrane protein [Thermoanaerobaculia bacterium]|nr:BamA/TamA family outer membrane protein [Thermoanaerobaculia bacterium]
MRVAVRWLLVSFVLTLLSPIAQAQYFGRNKVQWEAFDFKVLQTEHFDIYYYDEEADVVHDVARMSERWYARLSRVFNHSFKKKPIVLYANPADFHQTTTTGGILGEGTGGFTDAFMNRVVLPLTGDYQQNDHVLGHEMVHVFQYDIAANSNQQRRRFALEALPLWIIEGMAEYFSKGRVDPLTAMWIRDATLHDRMPNLRELTRDSRYFPYRYGQALMAYIGARFGDEAVVRYFMAAGVVGPEDAVERALGISHRQLFADWAEASRELYSPITTARTMELGTPLIGKKPDPPPTTPAANDAERRRRRRRRGMTELNVGPALSPDGRFIAFLSARELFSIDLFLADAKTGKVIRKLVSSDRDSHFESLRFIESAGAWSPDSRRIAFITFSRGDNYLSFVDVESRATEHVKVAGLESIGNVAWSPDGRSIALSGQTTGVSDLFVYDVESKDVRRLTGDKYADLQPQWSPDGRTIVFATDRGRNTVLEQLQMMKMRLATIEVSSGTIREIEAFPGALHINPHFAPDGQSIYFIANPEGIPDVYRITVPGGQLSRVTAVDSGVAGITDMSPALTVAARTGELAFSVYEDDNYNIYALPAGTTGTAITAGPAPADNAAPRAALLPPLRGTGSEITAYLMRPEEGLPAASSQFTERDYSPNLRLAYLGPPTLGVGINEFGFGGGGSVTAYFSDILGQHNVGFTFQGGGGSGTSNLTEQLGGELFYLNQKHRLNWGADLIHIPYVYGAAGYFTGIYDPDDGPPVNAEFYVQQRNVQLITDASGLAQYPFSATRRIEGAVGMQRYSQKIEEETFVVVNGQIVDREINRLPGSFAITFGKASAAFVGDSSLFGFISPINGTRYRYEIESLNGDLNFQTALADWRRYFFFRPMTVAVRGLHYGRYGTGAEDERLSPLYLGQGSLMRGYDPYSIDAVECGTDNPAASCPVFDRLIGTRLAMASLEVRAPLFGTREFGLINAPFLPTEIYAFGDAGAAWSDDEDVTWEFETRTATRVPVFSVGVGVRVLLSYIPIEFYAAKPFQRPDEDIVYGFNIAPGW